MIDFDLPLNYRILENGSAEITGVLKNAEYIKFLIIPDIYEGRKVTSIGKDAFKGLKELQLAILPNTVEEIGTSAFSSAEKLIKVVLPSSLKTIRSHAFGGCLSLKSVDIPFSVTYIDNSAFDGCRLLESISVSDKNKNFSSLDGVLFSKDYKSLLYYPEGKSTPHYSIPDTTEIIGEEAFKKCHHLESIYIPESVKIINRYAISDCKKLVDVALSEGLERIERHALRYTGIEKVSIPDSVSFIGEEAFYCSKLHSINTKNNPNYISKDGVLFDRHNKLVMAPPVMNGEYEIPEGTEIVGAYAFSSSNIESVKIPSSVISIEEEAFSQCEKLKEVIIPDSVEFLGRGCFEGCLSLEKAVLPNTLLSLPDNLFNHCYELKKVNLPSSLHSIGTGAFSDCRAIEGIEIPQSLERIGGGAFSGTSIHSITIPDSVRRIGCWAFSHSDYLTEITIPDKVTEIEHNTFRRCKSLKRVTLGKGIKEIDDSAFEECPEMEEIIINRPKSSTKVGNSYYREGCSIKWNHDSQSIKVIEIFES